MEAEARAERLYLAVVATIHEIGMMGLLAAAGDAKARLPWAEASPKTQDVFRHLAANLTVPARTA